MNGLTRTIRGYTLLELVLVLAILATTIAVAAPMLSAFARGRRAEEAARQFLALTRWARSQAVTDGQTYQLNIDASAGRWWLSVQDQDGGTFSQVSGPFGKVFVVPEGVQIQPSMLANNGQQAISFDPTGRCDTGVIHFVGMGSDIVVTCDAPVEPYRILKDNGGRG